MQINVVATICDFEFDGSDKLKEGTQTGTIFLQNEYF